MEHILETRALRKKYRRLWAVDGADMHISRGDIYGFVGENGSGKTTIIRLICGLIFPTDGTFTLFGKENNSSEIGAARKKLGAIVEAPSVYKNFSAEENLKMQCRLTGTSEECIPRLLSEVGLSDLLGQKKRAADFSLGMRQRLGIAMALVGEPEFLILDEPMNGLDPAGIVEMRELILRLNRERGITFLISSHILSELELIATKYGIISHGKLLCEVTSEELHNICAKQTVFVSPEVERLHQTLAAVLGVDTLTTDGASVKVSGEIDLNRVLSAVLKENIPLTSIHSSEESFESFYLSVIGGGKHV